MTSWIRLRSTAPIRILLEAAAIIVTFIGLSRALSAFIPAQPSALHTNLASLRNLLVAAASLVVYTLMIRWIERRRADEIAAKKAPLLLAGAALGVALMAAVYGILGAAHLASFSPGTGLAGLGSGLALMLLAGVAEELLFRAVLFRIVEQACGTTAALLGTAALFGLVHGLNPGATVFSDVAIAIEAGLLLGTAYALTRSLWLPIGIHAGWNFAEGSLFGAAVSGHPLAQSLIHSTLTGPTILTGGTFGPEASLVSIAVCGCVTILFSVGIVRRGAWQPRRFRLMLSDGH